MRAEVKFVADNGVVVYTVWLAPNESYYGVLPNEFAEGSLLCTLNVQIVQPPLRGGKAVVHNHTALFSRGSLEKLLDETDDLADARTRGVLDWLRENLGIEVK